MREFLAALACVAFLPFGWIELTKPDVVRASRSPTLQEVTQAPMGPVPQREVAIESVDPAPLDLSFAPVRETLPMPRKRPPAVVLLAAEADRALGQGARDLGVRRTLWCMAAINTWLMRIGVKGTGSDLAVSVRSWGVASKAVPGAIALKPRRGGSGHVVIVKAIRGNTLIAISPNHNGKVREARYPLRVFYAFRAPA